eukprot:3899958-Amphidinium_carterae.1
MAAEISGHMSFLDNVAQSFSTLPPSRDNSNSLYPVQGLLSTIVDADLLKGAHKMRENLAHCIQIVVPPLLRNGCKQLLEKIGTLPSRQTVERARFSLDAGFALHMRRLFSKRDVWYYLWSDSSPQGSRNWAIAQLHMFDPKGNMNGFYVAWSALRKYRYNLDVRGCLHPAEDDAVQEEDFVKESKEAGASDIELDDGGIIPESLCEGTGALLHYSDSWRLSLPDVRFHSTTVAEAFEWHAMVPASLGSGHEKLVDKTSALVHQICLECHGEEAVETMLRQCVSITTDLGTEQALADSLRVGTIQNWCDPTLRPLENVEVTEVTSYPPSIFVSILG